MTRISRVILPIVMTLTCMTHDCHGFPQETPEATQLSAATPSDDVETGIEAVYCFNYSIPWMSQNGVIYVTYLVTKDDWAAHVDSEPGFINAVMSPPLVSTLIHVTDERVEFSSPFTEARSEFPFVSGRRRRPYSTQDYALTELVHSFDECKVWRIPDDAEQRMLSLNPAENRSPEVPYAVNNLSGQFQCNLRIQKTEGRISEIQQTPIPDWTRTHSGFQEIETRRGTRLAAGECRISKMGDQFIKFNEIPQRGLVGDHPRHDESGLIFHRGGRHVRTDWKQLEDVVVPENISVTLGTSGNGMLLRSARLLTAQQVSAAEITMRIQNLRRRTSADIIVTNLAAEVGRQFWRVHPADLDEAKKSAAVKLKAQQTSLLSEPLSEGSRVLLMGNRVLLTAATDDSDDLGEFEIALTEYLDRLGLSAGLNGQLTVLFNFLEMVRFWDRPDLEQLAVQQFTRLRSKYPAKEQIRALFFATGPTETTDIYSSQLIDSITQSLTDRSTPETLIRGAVVLASLRIETACTRLLTDSFGHVMKDPERRKQARVALLMQYSNLLEALEKEESQELQLAAQRLQKLLEIIKRESSASSEAKNE